MDTGIIGPVTVMADYLAHFGPISSTVHGLIVSSILIPAAVSSFFAGKVADILGRPRGISLGVFIFAVGTALEAGAAHLAMFIVGRCVEGIGEGLYLGNLVVYAVSMIVSLAFYKVRCANLENTLSSATFVKFHPQAKEVL